MHSIFANLKGIGKHIFYTIGYSYFGFERKIDYGFGCGESGNEDGDGDDCGWVSYIKTGFGVCGYKDGDGEEVEIDLEFE